MNFEILWMLGWDVGQEIPESLQSMTKVAKAQNAVVRQAKRDFFTGLKKAAKEKEMAQDLLLCLCKVQGHCDRLPVINL